jgi:uncharacterized protein YqhQ
MELTLTSDMTGLQENTPPDNNELESVRKNGSVGGQAVIEGVMMRSPHTVATAVRKPAGDIVVESFPFISISKKYKKTFGLPVIRGAVSLGEALYLGIKTLNWSAAIASDETDEPKKESFWDKLLSIFSIVFSLAAGMGIFMFIPYWTAGLVREADGSQFLFHAAAGVIRIIIFLMYLYLISLWKEIRRVFEYHGAEHKSIFAFEKSGAAEVGAALKQSRFHPRCGTSFLLITAIVVIFLFAVIDTLLIPIIGEYKTPFHRMLVHLPFIPIVAGIAYEILKVSGKKVDKKPWNMMVKPGLWLQHITTKEPTEDQLEVAICALNASLNGQTISDSSNNKQG